MNANVLNAIQYGIFAIGCRGDEQISGNACIVNTVVQVTLSPLKIAVAISKNSYTSELVDRHKAFSVSVLSEETSLESIRAIGFTSGRKGYKLGNVQCFNCRNIPVFDEKLACWFTCQVEQVIDLGTHLLFVADVTETSRDIIRTPMSYEYYHDKLIGRPTPINTQMSDSENSDLSDITPMEPNTKTIEKEEVEMSDAVTYTCTVCGYVYDGEVPFEQLPEDWTCPICGVGKDLFTTD